MIKKGHLVQFLLLITFMGLSIIDYIIFISSQEQVGVYIDGFVFYGTDLISINPEKASEELVRRKEYLMMTNMVGALIYILLYLMMAIIIIFNLALLMAVRVDSEHYGFDEKIF